MQLFLAHSALMYEPQRNIPLPPRARQPRKFIAEAIRALKAGESILVNDAAIGSVKSIVSRMRVEFEGRRRFATAKDGHGVRVWRLP